MTLGDKNPNDDSLPHYRRRERFFTLDQRASDFDTSLRIKRIVEMLSTVRPEIVRENQEGPRTEPESFSRLYVPFPGQPSRISSLQKPRRLTQTLHESTYKLRLVARRRTLGQR